MKKLISCYLAIFFVATAASWAETNDVLIDEKLSLISGFFEANPVLHYTETSNDGASSTVFQIYSQTSADNSATRIVGYMTSDYPINHAMTVRSTISDSFIAIFPKTKKTVYLMKNNESAGYGVIGSSTSFLNAIKSYTKSITYASVGNGAFELTCEMDMDKMENDSQSEPFSSDVTIVIKAASDTGKILETRTISEGSATVTSIYTFHQTSAAAVISHLDSLPTIDISQIDDNLSFVDAYNNELTAIYNETK